MKKLLIITINKRHKNVGRFFTMLTSKFTKIKTFSKHISDISLNTIKSHDLFYFESTTTHKHLQNYIHPNYTLNGDIYCSEKGYTSRIFESVFGKKLNVYYKDISPHNKKVFNKNINQTHGPYKTLNKPAYNSKTVNNIIVNNTHESYACYFIDGIPTYIRYYRAKKNIPAKNETAIQTIYLSPKQSLLMLKPHLNNIRELLKILRIDWCRLDFNYLNKIPYFFDVNTSPFAHNLKEPEFLNSGLIEYTSNIVETALLKRLEYPIFYNE